jgi:hypothetical protein
MLAWFLIIILICSQARVQAGILRSILNQFWSIELSFSVLFDQIHDFDSGFGLVSLL